MQPQRLTALDGIRGAAVLLVIGYHLFPRHLSPNVAAGVFPTTFAWEPFKYGHLGVDLFFIVSGFVIAMTLEGCQGPSEFMFKRLARLWPALVAWSAISFLILICAPVPGSSPPRWEWFLPSLTLTAPRLWGEDQFIVIVHWTLAVEIVFYLIAACLYWTTREFTKGLWLLTFALIGARFIVKRYAPGFLPLYEDVAIPDFLPWFSAGAVYFDLYRERIGRWAAILLLAPMAALAIRSVTLDSALSPIDRVTIAIIALGCFAVFWLIATRRIQSLPSSLVAVGRWSYSIYLLHYTVGLAIIARLSPIYGGAALAIAMALVCVLTVAFGAISHRTIEEPGRRLLMQLLRRRNEPLLPVVVERGRIE